MLDMTTFFSGNERVTIYRPGLCNPDGRHVLYWMQRSQRGHENAALNAAIDLGNTLDLPVVVVFVLTIFGLIRYMSFSGMQRKFDINSYMQKWNARLS